jgi:hypothetical protein
MHDKEALKIFELMYEEGVQQDDITFVYFLSTCSHAGMVDEGMHCYITMATDYMISTRLSHYTFMVDLIGRANHLHEVEIMVMAIPCKPQVSAWMALFGTCRIHGNVEMAAKQILEMEPNNATSYMLLSNIYVVIGNEHLSENVEQQKKEKGCEKTAKSYLE